MINNSTAIPTANVFYHIPQTTGEFVVVNNHIDTVKYYAVPKLIRMHNNM